MEPKQPRITQKMLLRTAILLFLGAAVFLGVRFMTDVRQGNFDPEGHLDSVGMIAAIHYLPEGSQVVVFRPDGTMIESPGYVAGKQDREAAWLPGGERVFFSSDREENNFHLFRWKPGSDTVVRQTEGSSSHSTPLFPTVNTDGANDFAIITSRGYVLAFDTANRKTQQLLPPKTNKIGTTDEGGREGQFDALYQKLGTSFATARWLKGRKWIAAVMNRDEGQILIVQNMEAENLEEATPKPVVAGEQIDIDVDAASGRLVYAVRNYQFIDPDIDPDAFVQNPNAVKTRKREYVNGVGLLDPDNPASHTLVFGSADGKTAFAFPTPSPDGSKLLFVQGTVDATGAFKPMLLAVGPLRTITQANEVSALDQGEIYEPSWSPSGEIAYVKREGGNRAIFTCAGDGSNKKNLTGTKGDFGFPKFSPMVKQ
jgi:hypothetical protein